MIAMRLAQGPLAPCQLQIVQFLLGKAISHLSQSWGSAPGCWLPCEKGRPSANLLFTSSDYNQGSRKHATTYLVQACEIGVSSATSDISLCILATHVSKLCGNNMSSVQHSSQLTASFWPAAPASSA